MSWRKSSAALLALVVASAGIAETLEQQRQALLAQLRAVHGLSDEQTAAVSAVFDGSRLLGQGNPAVTRHPTSPQQCREQLATAGVSYENPAFEAVCGDRFMVPLYDPREAAMEDARVCIDRFEFPSIPCEYPVVWVRAREAAQICSAVGKRLCDAHEWEGACEGRLLPPDYPFAGVEGLAVADARRLMRAEHNRRWSGQQRWAYGETRQAVQCATDSAKSEGCDGADWQLCGSNTYPSGQFPACGNALGALDLHGNAAEHMNLPTRPGEMAAAGGGLLGYTEMKGSWFIWDTVAAHPDWCRWRAPDWHGSRVMSEDSHRNYHLGFRCCKTLP